MSGYPFRKLSQCPNCEDAERRAEQAEARLAECMELSADRRRFLAAAEQRLQELEGYEAAFNVLAEYVGIGTDRPPEEVFALARALSNPRG